MPNFIKVKFCSFLKQILASEFVEINLSERGDDRLGDILTKLEQLVNNDKVKLDYKLQALLTQYASYAICITLNGMIVNLDEENERVIETDDLITIFAPVEGG